MITPIRTSQEFIDFLEKKCSERQRFDKHAKVLVEAPATIANFGPGFDVLAVALESPRDLLEIEFIGEGDDLVFSYEGIDIPAKDNIVYRIAELFHNSCGGGSIKIRLRKNIPVSRGLGSSGASSVASILGLSKIYGLELSKEEIISLAGYGESIVAGEPHYDNVAASLLGGMVIIDHIEKTVYKINMTSDLWIGIIIPNTPVPTNKTLYARSLLPSTLDRREVVSQISLVAKLLYAIQSSDLRLLGEAVSRDYLSEPYRSSLIPFYKEIKELALREGAYGFNISGAGPSMFLIARDWEETSRIIQRLSNYLYEKGYENNFYISKISNKGASIEVIVGER
ncbi:MAG: homoserine kinase [Sulfolobales archaeon]